MAEQPKPHITGKTFVTAQPERKPLTPEQIATFAQLRNVLDPNSQVFNPATRLGAQMMQEEGKQVAHWQSPLNVLGLAFHNDYLPGTMGELEPRMLAESGLSPTSARGQIAVGPEMLQGKRQDILPHELAHKAIEMLGTETYGIEEQLVRQLMINDGINVKENREFLDATVKNLKGRGVIEELASELSKKMDKILKERTKGKGK